MYCTFAASTASHVFLFLLAVLKQSLLSATFNRESSYNEMDFLSDVASHLVIQKWQEQQQKKHAYALTSADRELYPLCLLQVWLNLRYIVSSDIVSIRIQYHSNSILFNLSKHTHSTSITY